MERAVNSRLRSSRFVVDEPADFRVAAAAYLDPQVFKAEMERIFYSTWIYLGHESEIPNPGDYKSTRLGLKPVILVRDRQRSVRAFLNFCRHRGAVLCREEHGNATTFVCPYHNWTYRTSGELLSATEPGRYPAGFSTKDNGLLAIPRVSSYRGLVFGSCNADAPELEQFLGEARTYVDYWLGRAATGRFKVAKAHKYSYEGNWKFGSENVVDGYHPQIVHRSAFKTMAKFGLSGDRAFYANAKLHQGGATRAFPGGHNSLETGVAHESGYLSEEQHKAYVESVVALHGEEKAQFVLGNRHLVIFPNLALMDFQIRVMQPIRPDFTEIYSYPLTIDGLPSEVNSARLVDYQFVHGNAGVVPADDVDIFAANQTALGAAPDEWLILSRGMQDETALPSGERIGQFTDELPQRAFWRQWAGMMGDAGALAEQ